MTAVVHQLVFVSADATRPKQHKIDWDCPCLDSFRNSPCRDSFETSWECWKNMDPDAPQGGAHPCQSQMRAFSECLQANKEYFQDDL